MRENGEDLLERHKSGCEGVAASGVRLRVVALSLLWEGTFWSSQLPSVRERLER